MQGADKRLVRSVLEGEIPEAGITAAERALLDLSLKITESPSHLTREDLRTLREEGLSEGQIAEAVYVAAIFAFFNRVADAFGLTGTDYPEVD